ncbi:putative serine/threonine-protein kinase At1g54610 [Wolffia australiana]
MGGVCCKTSAIEDSRESPRERTSSQAGRRIFSGKLSAVDRGPALPLSRREELQTTCGDVVIREKSQRSAPIKVSAQELEKKRERQGFSQAQEVEKKREAQIQRCQRSPNGPLPKATEGEQVAAGWPPWLASVAGEAIRGWVPRRADSFEKLDKIGQGTYSNVYRARDFENRKIVALKKVRFDSLEPESVRFMAREIHMLRRLDHPNIIKLEGLVTSRMSCSLYLVFEYMEHDLAGLASYPGHKFTEPQIKWYMQQLLRGLEHCHSRNILHRDIKGSNLLIDDSGILKIADFGLANFFDPNQFHPLTSRVVTLWYRPPELLLGATNYGVAVDLWSAGCILAELYAGKPIMPGRTEVEQLHKIFKLCGSPSEDYWRKSKLPHATIFKPQQPYRRCIAETFKDFPPPALSLMDVLLSVDLADRGTSASALMSEFFTTKPLPCEPWSLPKYPPSKEFDAKFRDEESRRQIAMAGRAQRADIERKGARDSNAELAASLQKRETLVQSRSRGEKFSSRQEDVAVGLPMEPPRQEVQPRVPIRASYSGPLSQREQWAKLRKDSDTPKVVAAPFLDSRRNASMHEGRARSGRLSESRYARSGSAHKIDEIYYSHLSSSRRRAEEKEPAACGSERPMKVHYSGPLIRPSGKGNIDQMLREHDRHIQEAFRRARNDRSKARKAAQALAKQPSARSYDPACPLFPSSRGPA